jgi:hypothetical protein
MFMDKKATYVGWLISLLTLPDRPVAPSSATPNPTVVWPPRMSYNLYINYGDKSRSAGAR